MFRNKSIISWPALLASFLLLIILGIIYRTVVLNNGGVWTYPLDDTYIHLELARNFSKGMWGINPTEFSSASSSIAYTLLLAAISKIFGAYIVTPLVINIGAALILIWVVDKWIRRYLSQPWHSALILSALIILGPLPIIVMSGMEHTLQVLFGFLMISKLTDWLSQDIKPGAPMPWNILLFGMLTVAIRYEGLFIIAAAGLVMLILRQVRSAILLGIFSFIPVVAFGWYSTANGNYFLPNSLLVKTQPMEWSVKGLTNFLSNIFISKYTVVERNTQVPGVPPPGISLLSTQRLLIILPALFLLSFRNKNKSFWLFSIILLIVTLIHLALASTGWFYRYEAYLIILTLIVGGIIVLQQWNKIWLNGWLQRMALLVIAFFILTPFVLRSAAAYTKASRASINIYEQQYQMAQFVKQNLDSSAVAINDIGAVAYYTHSKVVDLWGLGSARITRLRKDMNWNAASLQKVIDDNQVQMAIIYDTWFPDSMMKDWVKLADWTVQQNVILGGETISFYAINPKDKALLLDKLKSFHQNSLPQTVDVKYY